MYIAKKPCHFKGEIFPVGEKIPEGMFEKSKVSALVKWGMIEVVDGEAPKTRAVESKPAPSAAQAVQNAPEQAGEAETIETATNDEKAFKTGRKGGRKKAGA